MAGKLKDIRFEPLSVQVLSIQHVSRVLIEWNIRRTAQNLNNLVYFIDRGESPSEMKQLNTVGIGGYAIYQFVDYTAQLFDLSKVYYYRVRAVEMQSGVPVQTFYSEHSTWQGNLDLVGLYVVEEHLFLERFVAGVPVMIFKKRREGAKCPECWDPILHRVTKSSCTTCYGTGKLGGYYPPIEGWMLVEPDPKMAQVAEWGRSQPNQTDLQFTNYPLLVDDDVIVEMKSDKRWKISNTRKAEKNRSTMLQIFRVSAVNPTDIEYKVYVPEDRRAELVKELEERNREREF
jgi:hypothetical protein